ncbi:MAG TPA: DNA-binding protein, partial [Acidimicrobiia bacterium]|nr:DNA-binding protein [Acidimicrobiia bacterium]
MPVEVIATYRPPWRDGTGRAVAASDEDATTMAVAAIGALLNTIESPGVRRVVVVTRTPALIEGPNGAVVSAAVGLGEDVPVEFHLGGGPAVLDVLTGAAAGTVVVGVDAGAPAAAAAALVSTTGADVERSGRAEGRLPARIRQPGAEVVVCEDPRLLRDLGWRQALAGLGDASADSAARRIVVGPPGAAAAALGGERAVTEAVSS